MSVNLVKPSLDLSIQVPLESESRSSVLETDPKVVVTDQPNLEVSVNSYDPIVATVFPPIWFTTWFTAWFPTMRYATYGLIFVLYHWYFLSSNRWSDLYWPAFMVVTVMQFINVLLNKVCPKTGPTIPIINGISYELMGWGMIVIVPIIEELIFRYFLPIHLDWLVTNHIYVRIICSVLFGLVHAYNITLFVDSNLTANQIAVCKQVIMTTLLGFVISSTALILSVMLHMYYNLLGFSLSYYICPELWQDKATNLISNDSETRDSVSEMKHYFDTIKKTSQSDFDILEPYKSTYNQVTYLTTLKLKSPIAFKMWYDMTEKLDKILNERLNLKM